ncbi:MAG: D-alanyl-D-alanine carboxypeptidase/D-alanyl-D-alanine-endopeptidase [Bacteroidales bacterium]
MYSNLLTPLALLAFLSAAHAETPAAVKRFLNHKEMKGASFALMAKEVKSGETLYAYSPETELIPASVMKLVTTAAALEILGDGYRFATALEYDGEITGETLRGNLYIKGGGDPTLGSSHVAPDREAFVSEWLAAVKKAGIKKISGAVIADESLFDTEGTSMKWVKEDMGSYYGAGCYGISVFDNQYRLYVKTGSPGSTPEIVAQEPAIANLHFHNYLKAASANTDSSYITGAPFSSDRYLYGTVPAHRDRYPLRGDIPDPALFLAQYLSERLRKEGIEIEGAPTCYRLMCEEKRRPEQRRQTLMTAYSPTLREIVRITNGKSHNLYAEALLKAVGLSYRQGRGETLSSAGKGIQVVRAHWKEKGLNTSSLWMHDGCGLAHADKLTASFMCDLLVYMATKSEQSGAFVSSLPTAGLEGSVASFLKGSALQGRAKLKSGGMKRIRAYAGYITQGDKRYAVCLLLNNYSGGERSAGAAIENLLLSLF